MGFQNVLTVGATVAAGAGLLFGFNFIARTALQAPKGSSFRAADSSDDVSLLVVPPEAPTTAACPPEAWVKADFGSGHWILDHTDKSWEMYMEFLHVPPSAWSDEFNCSDIHQYIFTDRDTFVMNHTIPKTHFHLLFEAGTIGKWEKNPYPAPTPAGFDPAVAKVNLTSWRNAFDAGPDGTACSALRTDMPTVMNDTITHKPVEYVVTFWRELVSPTFMKASLHVTTPEGELIEPWKSKGLSHRYFRKTVQSFEDAALRLPCAPTGLANESLEFC
jgi:hypothetical protein